MKRILLGLLTTAGIVTTIAPAEAAIFTFALENATYAGGGSLNGTFQFDTTTGEFLSDGYNVTTNPNALNQSTFVGNWIDNTSNVNSASNVTTLALDALPISLSGGGSQFLTLLFDTNISTLALNGTANLIVNTNPIFGSNETFVDTGIAQSAAVSGGIIRLIDDGSFTAPPGTVPEPLTILGAGAAIGLGAAFKRKLTKIAKKSQ
ncbi:MAG TPA: hypothetical protein DCF68_11080 [Cyanothece sp. UBA12306]|nr:hypothetical protein [Cyanothece sp. UBA12306]